jgi:hypothetical protein
MCGFLEVARHGAQRLIKTESHVPSLAGEDRKDRGGFGTRDPARKAMKKTTVKEM